ncbi:hypothetical protein [Streptomyces sp. NPDC048473]|uniref:hypothetical protein n=1 Tax=unclassified Streptomyces TaxID=2593676 RepID=UPI0037123120
MVFMAASASAPPTTRSLKRIVAASLIGTTIEWYDNSSHQRYDLQFSQDSSTKVSTEPAPENDVLRKAGESG